MQTRKTNGRKRTAVTLSTVRSAITNGSTLFVGDVDQRDRWVRRFRDLLNAHASDLGGDDCLSEGQRALIRRAAMLEVQLEFCESRWAETAEGRASPRQLLVYQRTCNTLRRLLESLELHRGRKALDITPPARPDATRALIDHIRSVAAAP